MDVILVINIIYLLLLMLNVARYSSKYSFFQAVTLGLLSTSIIISLSSIITSMTIDYIIRNGSQEIYSFIYFIASSISYQGFIMIIHLTWLYITSELVNAVFKRILTYQIEERIKFIETGLEPYKPRKSITLGKLPRTSNIDIEELSKKMMKKKKKSEEQKERSITKSIKYAIEGISETGSNEEEENETIIPTTGEKIEKREDRIVVLQETPVKQLERFLSGGNLAQDTEKLQELEKLIKEMEENKIQYKTKNFKNPKEVILYVIDVLSDYLIETHSVPYERVSNLKNYKILKKPKEVKKGLWVVRIGFKLTSREAYIFDIYVSNDGKYTIKPVDVRVI